jgi:RecB family exonuclease
MKINFGLHLDGYEHIEPQNSFGEVTCGPQGMLAILETRLGLTGSWPEEPMRQVQYLHCLRACDDGKRFYSRSFNVDELAVARVLLHWRDVWIEAGWHGDAGMDYCKRIKDLAAVEQIAKDNLNKGRADRLRAVVDQVGKVGNLYLSVRLLENLEDLPWVWQQIFSHLHVEGKLLADELLPLADQGSDLFLLQDAILKNSPCTFQGDGSVIVLTAHSNAVLSNSIASMLASEVDYSSYVAPFTQGITVLNGGAADVLDMAMHSYGIPRNGVSSMSRWRPQLQVLPLVLSLLWEPLDPFRLLEFLTNPSCPLPNMVRQRLAEVVAEYPGINSEHWQKVIEDFQKKAEPSADSDSDLWVKFVSQIDSWLSRESFNRDEGAPTSLIAEKCAKVAQWHAGQSGRDNLQPGITELHLAASAQAGAAARILDEMAKGGMESISSLQLDSLVDQVTASGASVVGGFAEMGRVHLCSSPASVFEPNDRVVWWNFTEQGLASRWPWSPLELDQLKQLGVHVPAYPDIMRQQTYSWKMPVLLAKKQIIFTVPRVDGNDTTVHHPFWDQLCVLTNDTVCEIDIDSVLSGEGSLPFFKLELNSHGRKEIPKPVRWWKMPNGNHLEKRGRESYSSLNAFIASPYQWVLNYKARLRPGSLAQIDEGPRQKGNLLHSLFQKLFESNEIDWKTVNRKELAEWVNEKFLIVLRQEGANYLLSGKSKEREELVETAVKAAWNLIEHLNAATVVEVSMEQAAGASFSGGGLGGYIDMLVKNNEGKEAVLDLKLSGGKYRASELQENRHLQLAVYGHARKFVTGRWPSHAFYILTEARLLVQNKDFFPDAEVFSPPDGESTASLWLAFEQTWKWRRAQIDKGLIEVTVQGTEPDAESIPPEDGIHLEEFNDKFNDYAALTGWVEGI